jgi:hypothetical protein
MMPSKKYSPEVPIQNTDNGDTRISILLSVLDTRFSPLLLL